MQSKYKRVLIKLSGEALSGEDNVLDFGMLDRVSNAIKTCVDIGVEVAILVGAGNIWRGAKNGVGMNRSRADHMGMLATVINALALEDSLLRNGVKAVAMSSIEMTEFAQVFVRDKAIKYMTEGNVVVLGGGIGNPYFTTDTAAIIRAGELDVDVAILAKNIDAIYDKDPRQYPDAKAFGTVDYEYIISHKLGVIDLAAAALSSENNIPLLLCALEDPDNIVRAVCGEEIGTVVTHMN